MEGFNFKYPIQLRWKDMDALGHVNNATFVTYFEVARGTFMLTACPGWDWHKNMFLIANIQVDFHKEILLTTQDVNVHIRTKHLGTKSFVLEYLITSTKNDQPVIHASGTTTQIMFDMKNKFTIEIPDWVRENLQSFDKM